jgi:CRP-like cAMP-binding protein
MVSDHIHQFGYFSDHDKALLVQALVEKNISYGDILLREGQVCQSVYFVAQGAFIQYNFKDEIDQNIIDFHMEGEWMLNQQSFVRQRPSETIIEAYANGKIHELTMQKLHELIGKSPAFFQLAKVLEPAHSRIQLFDNQLTPAEKYQFVLNNRPGLLQAFLLPLLVCSSAMWAAYQQQ